MLDEVLSNTLDATLTFTANAIVRELAEDTNYMTAVLAPSDDPTEVRGWCKKKRDLGCR